MCRYLNMFPQFFSCFRKRHIRFWNWWWSQTTRDNNLYRFICIHVYIDRLFYWDLFWMVNSIIREQAVIQSNRLWSSTYILLPWMMFTNMRKEDVEVQGRLQNLNSSCFGLTTSSLTWQLFLLNFGRGERSRRLLFKGSLRQLKMI